MKKILYIPSILAIILLIVSCKDNTVNPTKEDGNFLKVGSYWINENFDYDENNNEIAESKLIDTLTVLPAIQYNGRTAYPIYNGKDTTMYMSFDGKSLYINGAAPRDTSQSIGDLFGGLMSMDWVKIADFNSKLNDAWIVMDKDTTLNLDFEGIGQVPGQIKLKIKVTNIGESTYAYKNINESVTRFKFDISIDMLAMNGLISIQTTTGTIFDLSYTKGFMQTKNLGQTMKISYMGQAQTQTEPGDISKTIEFLIKK